MTKVAGEACDGFLVHPFTTDAYLRYVTIPALEEGMAVSGRQRSDFEISLTAFVVSGDTEEEMKKSADAARSQLAFYGSTPAYRGVLEHHGWGDLQTVLNALSKQGDWQTMATLIDDDVLNTFAVVTDPHQEAAGPLEPLGGLLERAGFARALAG